MSHGPHENQPGFSAHQLLVDGCRECLDQSHAPWTAIDRMDQTSFMRAWMRAVGFETGQVDDVSAAEIPILRILWVLALKFQERGFPLGPMPGPFDAFVEVPL